MGLTIFVIWEIDKGLEVGVGDRGGREGGGGGFGDENLLLMNSKKPRLETNL